MNVRFRFSLASLLFFMALVAGFCTGHMRGQRIGHEKWTKLQVITESHYLGDIVTHRTKQTGFPPARLFDELTDDLKKDVLPHVWNYDSNTKFKKVSQNFSITVTGNPAVHFAIEEYIEKLRLDVVIEVARSNATRKADRKQKRDR